METTPFGNVKVIHKRPLQTMVHVLRQTTLEQEFRFSRPIVGVCGMVLEYINSANVTNTSDIIWLSCAETTGNISWNSSSAFGVNDPCIWVQPFPIPDDACDRIKSHDCFFNPKQLFSLHFSLKPSFNVQIGVGGYIHWKVILYYDDSITIK